MRKFYRAEQVLIFLNTGNPAAARYGHRIERVAASSVDTSHEWGLLQTITTGVLKKYHPSKRRAFELRFVNSDPDKRLHVDEIAKRLHRSRRTIYKWLDTILIDLEREYIKRDVIEGEDGTSPGA